MIYKCIPKFYVRHERVSFYGPRESAGGADTELIYNIYIYIIAIYNIHIIYIIC